MSHELFGDRFAGRDKPGWHRLGTVFTEAIGAIEALKLANMGYTVEKIPLVGVDTLENGSLDPLATPWYGIWRSPVGDETEKQLLSTTSVSEDFTLVQNMRLGEMVEPFTKEWPVETVAALKNGSIAFITLNVGEFDIAGEQHTHYLAVNNGHDGGRALSIDLSDVRRVCWNTLVYGERNASIRIKLRHTAGVIQEAEWYTEQILAIRGGMAAQEEQLKRMAEVKMNTKAFKTYTEVVFPEPEFKGKKSVFLAKAEDVASAEAIEKIKEASEDEHAKHERLLEWRESLREASLERWGVMQDAIAGTVYGGYQAVNETVNWRKGPGNADESILLSGGARNKELVTAYDAALSLVK